MMHPPRTLHVIDNLRLGGAQRLLLTLAEHPSPAGPLNVMDFETKDSFFSGPLVAAGARLKRVDAGRIADIRNWVRLWRAIGAAKADVLHLHLTNATVFGAVIGRAQRRKVVVTLHNTRTVSDRRPLSRIKRWAEDQCLRHYADHVVLVGKVVLDANLHRLKGVPHTVLTNVLPRPAVVPPEMRSRLRADLGAGPGDVVLIATGRLSPQKDHATLLNALALIAPQCPDVRLWIAGDGALRETLAAQARDLGISDRISMLGARPDIGAVLAAADLYVMSSSWEGLPLGLLEAMAQGLPAVATAVGDVVDVLARGGGVLVPPHDAQALADAIVPLCRNAETRADMGLDARRAVEPYTDVELWRQRTEAIYRQVLGAGGSTG